MSSSPVGDRLTWKSCTRRPRRGSVPYSTKVTFLSPLVLLLAPKGRGLAQHTFLVSSRKTETEQGWLGPWRHPEPPGEPCPQLSLTLFSPYLTSGRYVSEPFWILVYFLYREGLD